MDPESAGRDNPGRFERKRASSMPLLTGRIPGSGTRTGRQKDETSEEDGGSTSDVVDLTGDSPCKGISSYEPQPDAVSKRLELPGGSKDYVTMDNRTKRLLNILYTNMESQIKKLQNQNDQLEHKSNWQKVSAQTWELRHSSLNAILDRKTMILHNIITENDDLTSKLKLSEDTLEDKHHEWLQCQQDIQRLQEEQQQKDVEMQARARAIEKGIQDKHNLTEQLETYQHLKECAENETVSIKQSVKGQIEARDAGVLALQQQVQDVAKELQDTKDECEKANTLAAAIEVTFEHFTGKINKSVEYKKRMQQKLKDEKEKYKLAQEGQSTPITIPSR